MPRLPSEREFLWQRGLAVLGRLRIRKSHIDIKRHVNRLKEKHPRGTEYTWGKIWGLCEGIPKRTHGLTVIF